MQRNWRAQVAIPCAILLLFACFSFIAWSPSHFVLLSGPGIGEMFEAYHAALNVERFGWRWGGLQDMATNPDAAAHPFLYIHHPNFGLYFSYLLRKLGVVSVEMQNFFSILGTLLGLVVAYLLAMRFTRSVALSVVFLALLSLDFYFIENWAFNLHRAFSYASVVGTFYAFINLSNKNFKSPVQLGIAFLACCTLLGTDYMFYFFCLFAIAFYLTIFGESWRWRLCGYVAVAAIFGAVFAARQLQVIAGIGLDIWTQDFLFQVLNRLHLESYFAGDWSRETTEFYSSQSVLNPGFVPPSTWLERSYAFLLGTGEAYLRGIVGFFAPAQWASLAAGIAFICTLLVNILAMLSKRAMQSAVLVAAGALALTLGGLAAATTLNLSGSIVLSAVGCGIAVGICGVACWRQISKRPANVSSVSSMAVVAKLGLVFLVPCLILMAIFPSYFTNWYRAFLLAPLCVTLWLVVIFTPFLDAYRAHILKWAVVVSALKAISVVAALYVTPFNHGGHAEALRAMRGVPTASNFTPASIATYTEAFSGFLQPDKARKLLETGDVEFSDYFMAFERDRGNPLYRHPQFFVFLKEARIFGGDWSFLNAWTPVDEGDTYAIYAVPDQNKSTDKSAE